MEVWSYIGVVAVIFIAIIFIKSLGKELPVLELMLLVSGLQWIIGPVIEYLSPSLHYRYYMYVDESIYMSYVVPAYMLFSLILLYVIKKRTHFDFRLERLKNYSNYGLMIVLIGAFFDFFGGLLPDTLKFLAFILSNFKFVGAIILFYSENKKLKGIFYVVIFYLLIISISKAFFHDFILWSVFFYMFWALKNKPSVPKILATMVIGVVLASSLQTIKAAYRMEVWNNYSGNNLELFVNLMIDSFFVDETNSGDFDDGIDSNVRLNQGWIISAVLDHIPYNRDYFYGETIRDAVFSSILPRVINPSKTRAGGQENFKEFTGLDISKNTSMGISIIGEAYGNFAVLGGIFFMVIWGFFLGKTWLFLIKKTKDNIVLIAFIPLIFLQVIKAETELVVVLNHLIKSMIVVLLFIWFSKIFLTFYIENER